MKTINDFDFKGRKALIRVDFNVPLNDEFEVTDNTRIKAAKPTVIKILEDGGSCILMSHLGRPKGPEDKYSLRHIVDEVEDVFGVEVHFANDCIGPEAEEAAANLKEGEILILENLRFHSEEKEGEENFAESLSRLGDIYVNDAFGTAHRAHASTATVASFFEDDRCMGLLLAKEMDSIKKVMLEGESPVTAILGGAKVSSKITIIDNILDKIDHLIVGGGMAYTFSKALGGKIGDSLVEDDHISTALEIMKLAKEKQVQIHLPKDTVITNAFDNDADSQICPSRNIPDGWMGLDIGPETRAYFSEVIKNSKTILWNGPLGVFEMSNFAAGTIAIGEAIAEATSEGSFSLVGGGDSVAAAKQFGLSERVSYVSTGGGAMLESLEGKVLPGIAALQQ